MLKSTKVAALAPLLTLGIVLLLKAGADSEKIAATNNAVAVGLRVNGRSGSCAAPLKDGSMLITGGHGQNGTLDGNEFFSAKGGAADAPGLTNPRAEHACAALPDGRVLVVGGKTLGGGTTNTAEVFDPAVGTWSAAGAMSVPRSGTAAAQLPKGRILIAGGESNGNATTSLEIFDPATNSFAPVNGQLSSPRMQHATVALADGRVLIAGGTDGHNTLHTIDVFDPAAGTVTAFGQQLSTARQGLTATLLLDGRVYFAGGSDGKQETASAEIYDPKTDQITPAASMSVPRSGHLAIRVPNNNSVLIIGGNARGGLILANELYIPWWNSYKSFAVPGQASGPAAHAATSLKSVQVRTMDTTGVASASSTSVLPTLTTDKPDYAPGDTVQIAGSGWTPASTVTLVLDRNPVTSPQTTWTTPVDASGNFATTYLVLSTDAGVTFTLTASSDAADTAQTITFTDTPGDNTSLALSCSPNPVSVGSPATCTAEVDNTQSGAPQGYPQGTVKLSAQTAGMAGTFSPSDTCTLGRIGSTVNSSCSVTFTPSAGVSGTIKGQYNASSNNWNNANATTSLTVNGNISTITTLVSSANPSVYGQGLTFTATIEPASGSTPPAGSVQFAVDGVNLGSPVAVSGGTATSSSISSLTVSGSPHAVSANFTGTGVFTNSTGSLSQTVKKANATINITPYSVTYDGNAHTAAGTATGVNGETLSGLDLSGTTHTAAGTYASDSWTFTDSTGNYTSTSGTVADTIAKANATITVTPYNVTYDGGAHTASGTAAGLGAVDLSAGLNLSGTTHTNAGDYPGDAWTFTDSTGNYNNASGTVHDTIAKLNQTITVTSPNPFPTTAVYGSSFNTTATGGASGSAVTILGSGGCTGSGSGTATITMVSGTAACTVSYNQAGSTNYNAAPTVSNIIGAIPAPQSIAFTDPTTAPVLGAGTFTEGVAATPSGDAVTVVSTTPSVCKVNGDSNTGTSASSVPVTIYAAGTCSLSASVGADLNYTSATATRSVTVGKYTVAACPITGCTDATGNAIEGGLVNVTASVPYQGQATVTVTLTPNSVAGLPLLKPVAGDATTPKFTVYLVPVDAGGTPTGLPVLFGSAQAQTIASPAGYQASLQAALPATFAPGMYRAYVYGDDASQLTGGVVANDVGFTAADTTDFIYQTLFSNTLTVTRADQTITFGALSNHTYGDADFSVSAIASSGLTVAFLASGNCTVTGNTVHITGAGSCTITAQQAGDADYNAAPNVPQSFTIAKANATISVKGYSVTYDGNAHTATGTATGVNGEDLSSELNLSTTTHTNAGTYGSDSWSFVDTTGNYNNASGTVSDSIGKANPTVNVTPYSVTYDGNTHTAAGAVTGVKGESLSGLDVSGTSHTNAGTYTADPWTFTDATGNYNNATGTVSDSIAKANATINVTPYGVTYDGNPHTATGTAAGVKGESLSGLSLTGTTHTAAGSYTTDSWTFTDVTGNYNNATGTVSDNIAKANASISVTPYSVTYDGGAHTAAGTAKGVGGVDLSASLTLGGTTHTAAGDYPSDAWSFSGGTNYNDASGTVHDNIGRKAVTPGIVAANKAYDGTAVASVTCSLSGVVGTDNVTCTAGSGTFASINAGTGIAVTATGIVLGGPAAGNYSLTSTTATAAANIAQAPLLVTAPSVAISLGSNLPSLPPAITGFVSLESASVLSAVPVCTALGASNPPAAGNYVTACSGGAAANYSFTYVNGGLTVALPVVSNLTLSSYNVPNDGKTISTLTATVSDANPSVNISAAQYSVDGGTTWSNFSGTPATSWSVSVNLGPYTSTEVLNICVRGTDALNFISSNTVACALMAVYNPNGGFVTGGGWILSPAGASVQYPTATGKANFGFSSQYKNGASTPTGNTEFQFQAGNLNFTSNTYQWLVVSGGLAQYKGSNGTINGTGNYSFILTACDVKVNGTCGGGNTDTFRIKISDALTGNVVYDNMMGSTDASSSGSPTMPSTALGGGDIVVHSSK